VSRCGFYRFDEDAKIGPYPDMDLRDAIQRVALKWPSYGRPRITRELGRRGWRVNAKKVYRLLREDNLLCVRRRKFVVTTNSNHGLKVYPNLAADMVLTGVDHGPEFARASLLLHCSFRVRRLSWRSRNIDEGSRQ